MCLVHSIMHCPIESRLAQTALEMVENITARHVAGVILHNLAVIMTGWRQARSSPIILELDEYPPANLVMA